MRSPERKSARSGWKKAKPKEAKPKTRGEIRKELHDKKRHLVKRIEECRRQAEYYAALAKQTDISVRRHVRDKQYRWERRGREAQQRLEEVRRMLDETAKGEEQNV